ncbi:MAG: hypothetical protein P1U37_13820 [Minwuia sp.]|nr:hypothetical protein [Minwuia sp.]
MATTGSLKWRTAQHLALLLVCGLLVGCGAGDFGKPVQQFAKGVTDTREAVQELSAGMGERARARLVARLGDPGTVIGPRDGECLVANSSRCRIDVGDEVFPPETRLKNILEILELLDRYAASLNVIVTRKTAEAVTASAGETLGHVAAIAEKAGLKGDLSNVTAQSNVTNLAGFFVTEYVDYVKVRALKRTTGTAQQPIREVGEIFGEASAFLGDLGRTEQVTLLDRKLEELQIAREEGRINQAERLLTEVGELALSIDASPQHTPAAVVTAMVASHDALVEALRRDDPSIANLHKNMQRFVAKGEELKALVEAFLK